MRNAWIFTARKAGFAAAMAFAANAGAHDWCPTEPVNYLTCSNCHVTLTCSTQGRIHITGNDVYLEGNYNYIHYTNGDAVVVTGRRTHIVNLYIWEPINGHGISYVPSSAGIAGHTAINVHVYGADHHGLVFEGAGASFGARLQLMGINVYDNGWAGVRSNQPLQNTGSANVFDSYLVGNGVAGFSGFREDAPTHARNTYSSNVLDGAINQGSKNGGTFSDSYFTFQLTGLGLINIAGPQDLWIYYNTGYGNWIDCDGSGTSHLFAPVNSWDTNDGCITKP